MKSLLLISSLFFLFSCGKEQFGTPARSESSQVDSLQSFQQSSCSLHTLVKPKVDILYAVDNSGSTAYLSAAIKNEIKQTVDFISKDFDYRVIGIPLIVPNLTDSNPGDTSSYQVLTSDASGLPHTSNRIMSSSEFNFFNSPPIYEMEQGLNRVRHFMEAHKDTGLFRKGAYHLVVLISNGRDEQVETVVSSSNKETEQNITHFTARTNQFIGLKNHLESAQFRFMAATASIGCNKIGWKSSHHSYQAMARYMYGQFLLDQEDNPSAEKDNPSADVYNLCSSNGVSGIFNVVNNSITKVTLEHKYRYWPITFAQNNESIVDFANIKVYKYSTNSAPMAMDSSEWSYYQNPNPAAPLNTRELPNLGEAVSGKHFIKFTNLLTYPDCVQIVTTSKKEYFGWVVLPRAPKPESIIVRVGGINIPSSALSYEGLKTLPQNIKVVHDGSSLIPAVNKTGYFIKITKPEHYYESGDNVEVHYTPDAIQ